MPTNQSKLAVQIGKRVSELRKRRGWSTKDLSIALSLSQPQISRLERGHQGFRTAVLERLAETFSVPVWYFIIPEQCTEPPKPLFSNIVIKACENPKFKELIEDAAKQFTASKHKE